MSVADILQAIATATFVGAFAFGAIQVVTARRARSEQAAIEIVHSVQNGPFGSAWRIVCELPTGVSAADVDARGAELARAADDMMMALEPLGYLVFRRVVPFYIANDLIGGVTMASWDRLRDWFEASRERTANPRLAEWYQWLAERLAEHAHDQEAAFREFNDWRPSR